jgi:hypothetical protein
MAKGKKKADTSSDSSSESSSASEASTSESTSETSSSEESSTSSSSSDNRKKSSKKSTKKSSKKDSKKSKKSKSSKESPKKRKKSKKSKKDPNAPKRATSAYFYYAAKRRADFIKEGSTLSMLEKSKQIGIDWKNVSDKDKAPYNKLAEADKVRYAKEKANYKAPEKASSDSSDSSSDDDKPKKKKQKKEKKDPNAPKRPVNGYMFYVAAQRPILKEKSPGLKPTEVTQTIGAQWKTLSDSEKKPYEKQYEEAKAEYAIALAKYEKSKK